MKIYTSYYNNLKNIPIGFVPIGVSLKTPIFALKRIKTFEKLFPDENTFEEYKGGVISEDDFRKEYELKLYKLNKKQIIRELFNMSNGTDIVLMCWEKEGFCHRHLIAKWLSIGGFKVEEL